MSNSCLKLANGVDGFFIKNDRFNTTVLSVNFYLPLKTETISAYALLPYVLTSCSNEYRDFSKLNFKLNMLYGADLVVSSNRVMDMQHIKIAISVINDEFTINKNSVINEAMDLLISLIFNPAVQNNSFFDADIEREKRKLLENIAAEVNEKRVFAKNRMLEIMFENSPYGISKYGTESGAKAITGQILYNAWQEMLKTAYVRVQVIGKQLPDGVFEQITNCFNKFNRENIVDYKKVTKVEKADNIKQVTEHFDVTQGKLVMGFSSEICGQNAYDLLLATDIFGGGPYSNLFTNVREKLSLCYYCSASSVRGKGFVIVQSGVEAENAEKAQTEILNQLNSIKNGNISDFTFSASQKAISGALLAYNDNLGGIDQWYSSNITQNEPISPEEAANIVNNITKQDVINAAKGINLNTVYRLMPQKEGE